MFATRVPQAHDFQTSDGVSFSYLHWRSTASRRGAIALIHDGATQGAHMAALAEALDLPAFDCFACDIGNAGATGGRDPRFAASLATLGAFVDHIATAHGVPPGNLHAIGHGDGALLLAVWAHDHAPRIRGLTLVAPTFEIRSTMPFARIGARLKHARRGPFGSERDAAVERTVEDAGAIAVPVQMLVAGADRIAHPELQQRFFDGLKNAARARLDLPGIGHDVFGAPDSAGTVAAIRTFVLQQFDALPPAFEMHLDAPRKPAADLSVTDAPPLPQHAHRTLQRWRGRLSDGIRLGNEAGFLSGSALEYIYRAEPHGRGAIGRALDARYLRTVEADALRQRARHVQSFVHDAMERLAERRRDVRLIDIASGPGRYLLDAVRSSPVRPGAVLLRDIDEAEVRAAQAWIARYEMQDVARADRANAFDRLDLASIFPRPTIAVAAGLYELFDDEAVVRRSLTGVGDAVQDGGFLIYTAAPWHPGPETDGRRRRAQAELDHLVEEAGFRKIAQRGDVWGLFSVALAQRTE